MTTHTPRQVIAGSAPRSGTAIRAALALLLALGAACRSTDPAFFAGDGRPIANLPAALYKVGVAVVDGPTGPAAIEAALVKARDDEPDREPPMPFEFAGPPSSSNSSRR